MIYLVVNNDVFMIKSGKRLPSYALMIFLRDISLFGRENV